MSGHDLPAGMVTLGGALQGFLTELEERCKREGDTWQESGPSNRSSGLTGTLFD
jgi:hypothetical protein